MVLMGESFQQVLEGNRIDITLRGRKNDSGRINEKKKRIVNTDL